MEADNLRGDRPICMMGMRQKVAILLNSVDLFQAQNCQARLTHAMYRWYKKCFCVRGETLCVCMLALVGVLLRFILIYRNWPTTNSDEGNMGIVARHIAYKGDWPIFFYGQAYMGPIESYIAAPLFHIFGSLLFTLRLGLLVIFLLFLICMYCLTRLLYTQKLAIFTVILLSLGSLEIFRLQLIAFGEYPETPFFAAFIGFAASWLALLYHRVDERSRTTARRVFIYGILGLIMGVALWVDLLILPALGTGILLLLLFCRRELVSWAGVVLLLGVVIGAYPLLYYNLTAPLKDNSVAVLLGIYHAGYHQFQLFFRQMLGTLVMSVPYETGFNPSCSVQVFPTIETSSMGCAVLQGGWGLGYLILWVCAVSLAACGMVQKWKRRSLLKPAWDFAERQSIIHLCCQLMLLVSAGGTIVLYANDPVSAWHPYIGARYLVCLLVATPAILWPLWKGIGAWRASVNWRTLASFCVRGLLLLLILLILVLGTVRTFEDVPNAQKFYRQQELFVQKLLSLGATRIYSEYWTCNRLIFQSNEQIICSVLQGNLAPGQDRYPPYRYIVRATPRPAFVFPQGMLEVGMLDARLRTNKQFRNSYQRLVFEGYVIYVPKIQRQSQPVASHKGNAKAT
jgi:hypothetical protein